MSGLALHMCSVRAKDFISPMFVDVSFNFAPFVSQVISFVVGAQQPFPGIWTTYGGATLFIGCTLLAMNYDDQKDLARLPLIGHTNPDDECTMADEIVTAK